MWAKMTDITIQQSYEWLQITFNSISEWAPLFAGNYYEVGKNKLLSGVVWFWKAQMLIHFSRMIAHTSKVLGVTQQ
jgi:hypothetical protein